MSSSAATLIEELGSQGITFEVDDDRLIVRAPKGAIDPDMQDRLRREKRWVMAVLSKAQPLAEAREKRRQKVLDMLATDDKRKKYYYFADPDSDAEFVILAVAIRGVATFEMRIRHERYDACLVAKALDENTQEH